MFWLVGVVVVVPAPPARTASGPRSAIRDLHGSHYNTSLELDLLDMRYDNYIN